MTAIEVLTALRKHPDNRYPTMSAMVKDLERAMGVRHGEPRGVALTVLGFLLLSSLIPVEGTSAEPLPSVAQIPGRGPAAYCQPGPVSKGPIRNQ